MHHNGICGRVGEDVEAGFNLAGRVVEGVEAETDEAAGDHDLGAEDGDGGVAVAEGHEGEESGEGAPGEGPEEVALERGAVEGDVAVLDRGDGEGLRGRSCGWGWV